jgi:hypothetical protein
MAKHIRCAQCRFARPDRKASERDWTAHECGNRKSEYYRALINITRKGEPLPLITWKGCVCGIPVERGDA